MRDDFAYLKSNFIEHVAFSVPNATRLAVMLCMHLNRKSSTAEVSEDQLAWELGIDHRSVRRQIGALAKRKLLSIDRRGRCNVYRIALPSDYRPLLNRVKDEREAGNNCLQNSGHECPASDIETPDNFVRYFGHGCPLSDHEIPDIRVQNSGHGCPPNPYIEPIPPIVPQNASDDHANFEWSAFERVWQFDTDDRRTAAKRSFEGLSGPERRLAIDRAPAYLRRCADLCRKRRHASRWLRDKGFLDTALSRPPPKAQRLPSEPITTERGIFIRISSEQWRAWSRVDGNIPALNTKFGVGCYKPSEWPPGMASPAAQPANVAERQP